MAAGVKNVCKNAVECTSKNTIPRLTALNRLCMIYWYVLAEVPCHLLSILHENPCLRGCTEI